MKDEMDVKIEGMLNEVKSKQAKIVVDSKSWKTNCSFLMDGSNAPITISTAREEVLVKLVRYLLAFRRDNVEASQILGVSPVDTCNGFPVEDWLSDCKKRMSILKAEKETKALQGLEGKLNKLMSAEHRREKEVEQALAELNSI